eukprot:GFUD01092231.1.p1 GENE.GFUD01092231.1~~GFUD01092231.1.p1  ORF type:complete len:341 (+),score=70.23 GFUD01092231.1:197-1219(+)
MIETDIFLYLITCSSILVAVVGNGLVLASILSRKKTREKKNSKFIVSLASADFLVGILVMPFGIAQIIKGSWVFGKGWCQAWVMLDLTLCQVSVYNMLAVNIDRFHAIYFPIHHYTKRTSMQVFLMIGLAWLLAPLIIGPMFSSQMASDTIWEDHIQSEICLPPTTAKDLPWILFMGILAFILPFTALIVLQVMVLIKQQEGMKTILNQFENKMATNTSHRTRAGTLTKMNIEKVNQRKITMMMAIVFAIFLIFWIPWWIMFMVFPFHPEAATWFEGKGGLLTPYNILTWMTYSNSCVEPFVYVTMDKDIRYGMLLMFQKLRKMRPEKNSEVSSLQTSSV